MARRAGLAASDADEQPVGRSENELGLHYGRDYFEHEPFNLADEPDGFFPVKVSISALALDGCFIT